MTLYKDLGKIIGFLRWYDITLPPIFHGLCSNFQQILTAEFVVNPINILIALDVIQNTSY